MWVRIALFVSLTASLLGAPDRAQGQASPLRIVAAPTRALDAVCNARNRATIWFNIQNDGAVPAKLVPTLGAWSSKPAGKAAPAHVVATLRDAQGSPASEQTIPAGSSVWLGVRLNGFLES